MLQHRPEAFCDRNDLEYASIDEVLTIVTHWCHFNSVKLEIKYKAKERRITHRLEKPPKFAHAIAEHLLAIWRDKGTLNSGGPLAVGLVEGSVGPLPVTEYDAMPRYRMIRSVADQHGQDRVVVGFPSLYGLFSWF